MKKKTLKSIHLSFLTALVLWTAPTFAMEDGENYNQMEAFRAVCWQLYLTNHTSSSLSLRLTCSCTKEFVDSTYTAFNNAEGIMPQWDNLPINGTLRYFLNHFVIKEIWCLQKRKGVIDSSTEQEREAFPLLLAHIGKIKNFLPLNQSTIEINFLKQLTNVDFNLLPDDMTLCLTAILGLPGNRQIHNIGEKILRIDELRTQKPQNLATDLPVWLELIKIDPHITVWELQNAQTSCHARIEEITQRYSEEYSMPEDDYEEYITPLNQNLDFIYEHLIFLSLNNGDVNAHHQIYSYGKHCNNLGKYGKAYEFSLVLENQFGITLSKNMELANYFLSIYTHCPSVDPKKLIEFERVLLNTINGDETEINTKNRCYQDLFQFYQARGMHESIINLYESKNGEMLLFGDDKNSLHYIINAYERLQKYEEAYLFSLDLENQFGITLSKNMELANYFLNIYTHCPSVDPEKLIEFERVLLNTINGNETEINTKNRCYQDLFQFYQAMGMHESIINLYESKKEEVFQVEELKYYFHVIINAYKKLQKYEEACLFFFNLENHPGIELSEHIHLMYNLSEIYEHCLSIDPHKLIDLENLFLKKINKNETSKDIKNMCYKALLRLYKGQNMDEAIIKLYESKNEEMFLLKDFLNYCSDIINAYKNAQEYEKAFQLLFNMETQFNFTSSEHHKFLIYALSDICNPSASANPHLIKNIENIFIEKINNGDTTIGSKRICYYYLSQIYLSRNMKREIVKLYESNQEEIIRKRNLNNFMDFLPNVIGAYNSLQNYEEAYQLASILEEKFDLTLPVNGHLLYVLCDTYAHCPSVPPQKLVEFERILLDRINTDEIMNKFNAYQNLIHLYATNKNYGKIIDLYESNREEMALTKVSKYSSVDIFESCLFLEKYDLALEILNHQEMDHEDGEDGNNFFIRLNEERDDLFRTLNYAIVYKAKGEHSTAMQYIQTLKGYLSSQAGIDCPPEEKLFLEAGISLIKGKTSKAVEQLNKIEQHREYALSSLIYLSEKFNAPELDIQKLKQEYQELMGKSYEECISDEEAYTRLILDLLLRNSQK